MFDKILRFLIYATIFLVPVFVLPFTFDALSFNKLYISFFLVWLAVLIWFLKAIIKDKGLVIKKTFLNYFILAFLAVAVLSTIFSVDSFSSVLGHYSRFDTGLVAYLTMVAFYFLVLNNTSFKEEEKKPIKASSIFKTLLLSSSLVMLFGYLALFQLTPKIGYAVSPAGNTLGSLAVFLSIMTIISCFVFLKGFEWAGDPKKSKFWFLFSGIFSFFSFAFMIIADFTPAWAVLIIGLGALVAMVLKKKILKKEVQRLILPIALIIISFLFLFLSFRVMVRQFPNFAINSSRNFYPERTLTQSESWTISLRAIGSDFKTALLGSGPGTFSYDFSKFKPESLNDGTLWAQRYDRSGNGFAEILAITGILGFLSLALLVVVFFLRIFVKKGRLAKGLPKDKNDFSGSFLAILFGASVLASFFYYQNFVLGFLFWLLLGLALAKSCIQEKEFKLQERTEVVLILETLFIVLFIGFVVVCFMGYKIYLADINFVKAWNNPDLDKKIEFLLSAINLNSNQPYYQMVLSQVLSTKAQLDLPKIKSEQDQQRVIQNFKASQQFARSAVQIAPNVVNTWEHAANLYEDLSVVAAEQEQFLQLALDALNHAVALDPRNPAFYTRIGVINFTLKKPDVAKDYFNKAIEQKRDYADANIQLALVLESEGNTQEAIDKLTDLSIRVPDNPQVLFQLGRLYYNQKETEKAISHFRATLNLTPRFADARYALALALEKQGKINQALENLEMLLKDNPNNNVLKQKIENLKTGGTLPEEIIEEPIEDLEKEQPKIDEGIIEE